MIFLRYLLSRRGVRLTPRKPYAMRTSTYRKDKPRAEHMEEEKDTGPRPDQGFLNRYCPVQQRGRVLLHQFYAVQLHVKVRQYVLFCLWIYLRQSNKLYCQTYSMLEYLRARDSVKMPWARYTKPTFSSLTKTVRQ